MATFKKVLVLMVGSWLKGAGFESHPLLPIREPGSKSVHGRSMHSEFNGAKIDFGIRHELSSQVSLTKPRTAQLL